MTASAKVFKKYEKALSSDLKMLTYANKGLKPDAFFDLADLSGIHRNFWAEEIFDISLKTLMRYQKEGKVLSIRNSELVLKLLLLFKKGIEVFGSTNSFATWLNKPAYGLGALVPMHIMNTHTGIDLIEEELIRIELGALA